MIRICLLLCFIFGSGCLLAQGDIGRRQLLDNSAIEYLRIAGNQSTLYYGKGQDGHPRATNHPYLITTQYAKARLSYLGVIYPEALLRLDLSRDELIVQSPDFRSIVLFPENVDFAELHDQNIIYFRRDTLPDCPSTGYYILLYSGNCKVLEKQTAAYMLNQSSGQFFYSLSTKFYLYKDGVYYNIKNKQGLIKALNPYKKEVKHFISTNHLKFRKNPEEFLIRTVSEYEKLNGSL